MSQIERIKQAIMADPQNASYTERGIEPLFAAPKNCSHQYHRSGTRDLNPRSRPLLER